MAWRKSTWSNPNGECVELAGLPDGDVALRNSQFPNDVVCFTRAEMVAFGRAVKSGEFDDLVLP